MATLISGLGGVAGYGEQSMRTLGVTTGNLDDGSRFVDATSVFGANGINFYGTNYTGFHLNTNGILTFTSAYTTFTPSVALTAVGQPNIAAFWTDIDINKGGEIYWDLDPTNGRIIVTWLNAAPYSGTGTVSFQMVLTNLGGGDLGVQYIYNNIGYTGSGGGAATVGVSNGSTSQTLAEGSSNAGIIAGYATNDFDTNDPSGIWGVNFEGGTLQTGNGIVDGTAGSDLINTAYVGDAQGDRIDNWDANGYSGTTGQGDYVLAGAGNDTVIAEHGNDQVFGGAGNDQLFGGYGNDSLDGGTENDSIDGGSANDTLLGGAGDDTLFGGASAAAITYTASYTEVTAAHQVIAGTSGRPNFYVRSQSGDGLANLTTGTNGGVSGFLLGDVDRVETHTHTASSQIQSSQINFNAIDSNETLTISIDGVAVNLNTLISSGAVTFNNSAGTYAIDASGRIIRTGSAATSTNIGSLVINTPHTSVSLTSAGTTGTVGMFYEYFVNTAPVNIAAENGGNDSILGDAGNDQLFGGDGNDTLNGGADQDTLDGGTGEDSLLGDLGNDSILGQAGNDSLFGGDGNDTLDGGADNDTLDGGAGDDSLLGNTGNDSLLGQAGNDQLFGGDGNDTLDGGDDSDTLNGGIGADSLLGGLGADSIMGDAGADSIYGGDGNDTVWAGDDNDLIFGGLGDDTLSGELGDDTINGDDGNDTLSGADGNDRLFGGIGDDSLRGATGNDSLEGGTGNDILDGGSSDDTLDGGDGDDQILAGSGNDSVLGGIGTDVIGGSTGNDSIYGGDGNDQIDAGSENDLVFGGANNDNVLGGLGDDTLQGDAGNDTMDGGADRDSLYGGAGDDSLSGGDGNDLIEYGTGNDTVFGGLGDDTIDDVGGIGSGTGDNLVYGGAGNDQIWDGSGNDTAYGGDGNDRFDGDNAGNDQAFGDAGNDTLSGGVGADTLDGGADHDQLYGGGDADSLLGDLGNDLLDGGAGNDTLTGGAGNDTFQGGDGADLIFGGAGDSVVGGEGGTDNDILRISADFYRIIYGGGANEAGTVQFLDGFGGNVTGSLTFSEIENVMCFTPGTRIQTARGQVAVEKLRRGDLVMTRDHGLQPLTWVGRRDLGLGDLIANPALRPVRIARGALGAGLPKRALTVSPQHRMLMGGARAEMLFGEDEVLVAATHLTGMAGVEQVLTHGISYIHVMFDRHEIICAEGAWSESFQPSARNIQDMDQAQRDEIAALFPDLAAMQKTFAAARMSLKSFEARTLITV